MQNQAQLQGLMPHKSAQPPLKLLFNHPGNTWCLAMRLAEHGSWLHPKVCHIGGEHKGKQSRLGWMLEGGEVHIGSPSALTNKEIGVALQVLHAGAIKESK